MMTWMTRMSLFDTAEDLDLNQQAEIVRDGTTIFNALVYEDAEIPAPLKLMWEGYEPALAAYVVAAQATMVIHHGVTSGIASINLANSVRDLRRTVPGYDEFVLPPWMEDTDVLRSHRSNLMRRWPRDYSWPKTTSNMPYIWPIVDGEGGYRLVLSKHDKSLLRSGDRKLDKKILERIDNA